MALDVDASRENMARRSLSEGAAGSERSELPETASVRVAVTRSVRSLSLTVSVPEVERPVFDSVSEAVSGPAVITGASLLPLMLIVTV